MLQYLSTSDPSSIDPNRKPKRHTLQPSHIFFTELRTFIPLTCSCKLLSLTPCTEFFPFIKPGLRSVCDCAVAKDLEAVHDFEASAVVEDRREGKTTRAVRRKVVEGIIFGL
jgi:hypothetical protein